MNIEKIVVNAETGDDLYEMAREMVRLANIYKCRVAGTFNGLPMIARPGDTDEQVCLAYCNQMQESCR